MKQTKQRKLTSSRRRNKQSSTQWRQWLWIGCTGVVLYLLCSFLVAGVGLVGQGVSTRLLAVLGGAVLLPLIHCLFDLIRVGVNRQAEYPLRQWCGTLFATFAVAIMLTFAAHAQLSRGSLMSPGFIGEWLSGWMSKSIGMIGLFLLGLVSCLMALSLYGLLTKDRIERWQNLLGHIHLQTLLKPFALLGGAFAGLCSRFFAKKEPAQPFEIDLTPSSVQPCENICEPELIEAVMSTEPMSPTQANLDSEAQQVQLPEETTSFSPSSQFDRTKEKLSQWLFGPPEPVDFEALRDRMSPKISEEPILLEPNLQEEPELDVEQVEEDNKIYEPPKWIFSSESLPDSVLHGDVGDDQSEVENLPSALSPVAVEQPDFSVDELSISNDEPQQEQEIKSEKLQLISREQIVDLGQDLLMPPAQPQPMAQQPIKVEELVEHPVHCDVEETGEVATVENGAFPPPLDLLGQPQKLPPLDLDEANLGDALIEALANFNVQASLAHVVVGPTVIQYQIQLAPGVKVSKVASLDNDIAVALAVPAVRVEAPVEGTSFVGIELPNPKRRAVGLRTVIESTAFQQTKLKLPLPLGQTVDGQVLITDLEELPHLLVAGTTGSGKSIFINNCITALCYHNKPSDLRFIMVDPKRVEMAFYEKLPHILAKPIVTPQAAVHALAWAVREMERRYEVFSQAQARNLASYNSKVAPKNKMPHIVVIVDELADLMMTAAKDVEEYIGRLAQMARATGIHLILATQRPSVNVITGTIKANIPARAAFSLPSVADSRTILDSTGAQHLLGRGDMLFLSTKRRRPIRIQSPFMDESANLRVVEYLHQVFGDPQYVDLEEQSSKNHQASGDAYLEDEKIREAVDLVLQSGIASSSRLQRMLRVGFTRAARLMDAMELMGIVGPADGAKPREILVDEEQAEEILTRHGVR